MVEAAVFTDANANANANDEVNSQKNQNLDADHREVARCGFNMGSMFLNLVSSQNSKIYCPFIEGSPFSQGMV